MSNFRQVHEIDVAQVDNVISMALAEDLGRGDITSNLLIPPKLQGTATILAKAKGILAGGIVAKEVFRHADPALTVEMLIKDGAEIKPGDIIGTVSGNVSRILRAERVVLNFLQRLSGIASQTALYVAQIRGLGVEIADTRKTSPGMRLLEKYAVRLGGGYNHRFDLSDAILIKDNHLVALRALGITLQDAVSKARQNAPPGVTVEVEVTNADEVLAAAEVGADVIMLDNMTPDEMNYAVDIIGGRAEVEASGGVNLDNVRQAALARVNIISIGALTHSSKSLDISLELEPDSIKMG
jgi:nicotinate-nucleotide pyrophosphorylase (carboxylating)